MSTSNDRRQIVDWTPSSKTECGKKLETQLLCDIRHAVCCAPAMAGNGWKHPTVRSCKGFAKHGFDRRRRVATRGTI